MVAETSYARCRSAAVMGLILQAAATAGVALLAANVESRALAQLTFYIGAGLPIWFVTLLVFRQRELAALEQLDLEELRREKAATGGGEALFAGEAGGALGFQVAQQRLQWMIRWLIPIFGVLSAAVLITTGVIGWMGLRAAIVQNQWTPLSADNVHLGLIILTIVMFLMFFLSRYAAGLGRVRGWQLLRGGGSYVLGNAIAALAIVVAFAVHLYQSTSAWEQYVALAIPPLMVLLGVETLLNLVLDIYRPRSADIEPRACFDSRLLGLISEPGGIVHSVAEAVNYQFGFEVSQTWFYQLLQRVLAPLIGIGVLAVWLLSSIVIVQPYERAIIERFGRQLHAETPLGPGLYFKWPAPIERARKYNTDQLHTIIVGATTVISEDANKKARKRFDVELWTDKAHAGRDHFNFVISPKPGTRTAGEDAPSAGEGLSVIGDEAATRAPVHLIRMFVYVQYKIRPGELALYTQDVSRPEQAIERIAWNVVLRYAAASHIEQLMGEDRQGIGAELKRRIAQRADELQLGVEIVYVGVQQVHPDQDVAKEFRGVVNAQQEKVTSIRQARIAMSEILSKVAGDSAVASALARALDQISDAEKTQNAAERELEAGRIDPRELMRDELQGLAELFDARAEAQWRLMRAEEERDRVRSDFDLGMGRTQGQIAAAEQRVATARGELDQSGNTLNAALAPYIERYPAAQRGSVRDYVSAVFSVRYWSRRIEEHLISLKGDAAVVLSQKQARRWELEMTTAANVTRLERERVAYRAAPEIYRTRSYLDIFVNGMRRARKYFLAFEPGDRKVRVRIEAQEKARPDLVGTGGEQN